MVKNQKKFDEALNTLRMVARTERAINDTYGPKKSTKSRRQLPGKRQWKNKDKSYFNLKTQLTVKRFNAQSAISSSI